MPQQRHLSSTPNRGPAHASPAAYRDSPAGSMTWEGNAQLDSTVNRNKNLKDAFVVQSWLIKSSQVLEKFKLDPLPDSYLHDSQSETGTDYSNAPTSEYDQHSAKSPEQVSPPESPPWRIKNEGGVLSDMPALALDEFRLHLAAFQEQERADAEAKRGQEQEHERQQELLREQLDKQAEHKRQVDMQKQAHAQKQAQEKQADAKRKQQEQHQKQQYAGIDRKEDGRQTPTQPPSAAAEAATAAAATAVAAAAAATKQITLGLSFSKCDEGGMKVARLKDGGCAALHGGIQIGDRVLRIDEQDLAEKSALQLNKLLSGPENSKAVLQVVKAGQAEMVTMVITRHLATSGKIGFGVVQR